MTKTFANIIVLGLLTMIGSWTVFKLVSWIGAAAIIVPLGVALTIGFLQLVLVLAKRQLAFDRLAIAVQRQCDCALRGRLRCADDRAVARRPCVQSGHYSTVSIPTGSPT